MRISTSNMYASTIDNLQRRQMDLSEAQDRTSSGKRVLKASDDPAAAARVERALAIELRSDTSQRSAEASRVVVSQTESALGDAHELLLQAREALVASGNGSYTDAERSIQAEKIKGVRDALFALANRSDGSGTYLFGGQSSNQPPFLDTPTGVQFRGITGQTQTDADTALPLSTDGAAAWLSSGSGNGVFVTSATTNNVTNIAVKDAWIDAGSVKNPSALFPVADTGYRIRFTSATDYAIESFPLATPTSATTESTGTFADGRAIEFHGTSVSISGKPVAGDQFEVRPSTPTSSVFGVLDTAIAGLRLQGRTGAQRAQATSDGLRDVDATLGTLRTVRSAAGTVLNRIDTQVEQFATQKLSAQTERSSAEDLDLVQAIADFKAKENGYDVALKSYSMVQRLSLFQYVNP